MAKFYGKIGYRHPIEIRPGVIENEITEKSYYGDVLRNSRQLDNGDKVNDDLSVGNSISIVADAYIHENFFAIAYIYWMGTRWIVANVDVEPPRLVLRLGGVYNGPTP